GVLGGSRGGARVKSGFIFPILASWPCSALPSSVRIWKKMCLWRKRRGMPRSRYAPPNGGEPAIGGWASPDWCVRCAATRRLSGSSGARMYAKPSSSLDSFAPHVLGADGGFLLVGTKDRRARTAEGTCNRLPINVAILLLISHFILFFLNNLVRLKSFIEHDL